MSKRIRSELTQEDVEALVATCHPRAKTGARDRALIYFLRMTGARVSEALSVRLPDVDRAARRIRIPGTKTQAAERTVTLPPALECEIDLWVAFRARVVPPELQWSAPLFCALSGESAGLPLERRKVNRMLTRRAAKAGLTKRVHPHAFRHGLAADMVRAGAPMPAIMAQLGHADLAVTSKYVGELAARQAAEVALAGMFDPLPPPS